VRADDLQPVRSSRDAWTGDLRALADQGLVQMRTVDINRESTAVVASRGPARRCWKPIGRLTETVPKRSTPAW
jgi:hypothetical protein